jgi:hypothetical protein
MKISKNKYLIFIVILGLFLRLYNLHKSIDFGWDQERDAFAAKQILVEKKPILIGPRVVGETGFMLAPHFFYILAPFYLIANLHPYATIVFIAVYSLIFIISSFFIIKKIYSQKIAYLFTYIWSILSLAIYIDTISWNPLLIPSLLIFLLHILNSFKFQKTKDFLLLGIYLGFVFNIHVQSIILFFMAFIFIISKIKNIKNILFIMLGFAINFIPLLVFDLRHNFLNFNLLINFFKNNNSARDSLAFVPVWTNYISSLFSINSTSLSIFFWLILAIILYKLAKININNKLLFYAWLFFPIIFIIYGKRPSEYYFNFCLPIIILTISQFVVNLKINPKILSLILIIFTIPTFYQKIKTTKHNPVSLNNKINAVKYIKRIVQNDKFNISYNVTLGQENGYSYLMEYYKVKPSNNFDDPLIEILIPSQKDYPTFGNISIKIPNSFNK